MHDHIFSFTAESIRSVSADWGVVVCSTGDRSYPVFTSKAHESLCTGGNRCNQCVILCLCTGRWICRCHMCVCVCVCVCTCPGVMAPPCSKASRQLRAEVRTAAAVRPACHTRLGSKTLHRNFSDSSRKCLE